MVPLGRERNGDGDLVAREFPVIPQPLAYLEKHLGDVFGVLGTADTPDDLAEVPPPRPGRQGLGEITGPGYDILRVFIPTLMPEHEFRGFPSREAFERGEYDEQTARMAPTIPEIANAFQVVFLVNRIDIVKHLGKVVSPELIQAFVKQAIGDSISELLLNSLSASGGSGSTSATGTPRTLEPSAA